MLKVYRVQNLSGYGMYSGEGYRVFGSTLATQRHPMPKDDAGLVRQGVEITSYMSTAGRWDLAGLPGWQAIRFGFANIAQYRNWVYKDEWRETLARLGYRIVVFEAADEWVRHGDTQAVFEPSHAHRIGDYPTDTQHDRLR